jgi:hypothetical protein
MKHKKRNEQSNASFSSPTPFTSSLNYRKIIRVRKDVNFKEH